MSSNNKQTPPMGGPHARGGFGKPKNFKKAWKNILSYTKPHRTSMIFAIIFAVFVTAITLTGPSLIEEITDFISAGLLGTINLSKITKIGIILACLYFFSLILNYLSGFIMSTVTRLVSKDLRKDISRKINVLPLSYLDKTTHGDMLSRITNDVDTISHSLDHTIITVITNSLLLIGSLTIMFIKNWLLTLCAIVSSLIGFALVSIIVKKSQKHFIAGQKHLGELNGHIEEIYGGHTIVKAYNAENEAKQEFYAINKKLYSSVWKSQFLSGLMMPIMGFIGNLGYVIVCVVGGVLIFNGNITFGTISAFMIYIRFFTQSLTQTAQVLTNLQSAAAAGERVFEVLEQEELADESHKTKHLDTCQGNVTFKNVKFGYTKGKTIIKNFSAEIKAGQKVAIVGPTGAGKTTLVNLLMRFYEIDEGSIEIDGIDTKELTRDNIHNLFSMVLQDTWIFNGTIKQNIVYNQENVSYEQIKEACKAVGLHHFIKTLPQGYDTILDENTNISAGQKQLLTIARAMIQNSPMLILDEATSSVDTRLEILIQEAMDKLTQNRTSFVIAHRLSTIKNADLILVLKDGDIIESGNHTELLAQNGFYAELYNSQFEEE
ncbi:MAG: ABC transporter ATP-binding protein [Clostridia bacterium]|nr:ABC transporter ATP-binding protein [Clostridia bacterium]